MSGHVAVGEDVIELLILGIAFARALRPFVLVGGVVDDHVKRQQHAALAHGIGEVAHVLDVAGTRVDVAEVADRVAAVARALRAFEDRHHMDHVDPEFLKVGQALRQSLQVAGESVRIERHADPFLAQEPVVVFLARHVELLERLPDGRCRHGQGAR